MKFYLSIIIFSGISLAGISQNTLSVKDFLATSEFQKELTLKDKEINFLKTTSHDFPWIEQLEFRTRTKDFEISQQEYIFRATPNSPRQRWTQKKIHDNNILSHEIDQQLLLEDALMDRYEIILDLYFCEQLIASGRQFTLVYEDKINVLRKNVTLSNFDITDLIKTEDDLNSLQLEILNLENTKVILQNIAMELSATKDSLSLDYQNFINIEDIKTFLSNTTAFNTNQHILLTEQQTKIAQLQNEYELEDAERRNILDFVESRFEGQTADFLRERFSVGIGLKVPLKGSSKLKLNELKLDQIKAENEQEELEWELERKQNEGNQKLDFLLKEHALLQLQLENSQARFSIDQYTQLANVSAYTLLKVKESLLQKERDILQKEQNIFETYLDLIHLSGIITERPLRNYLSADLENF
jgi:hypothetical protein